MTVLFHVREQQLSVGELILPGRWGRSVLNDEKNHPFFFREHLLEIWRRQFTTIQVSRFTCTYAYEDLNEAIKYADSLRYVYCVESTDSTADTARLDMLWLTWMGEPMVDTNKISQWCRNYWAGNAAAALSQTAHSSWERLFSCPLRVLEIVRHPRARSALN